MIPSEIGSCTALWNFLARKTKLSGTLTRSLFVPYLGNLALGLSTAHTHLPTTHISELSHRYYVGLRIFAGSIGQQKQHEMDRTRFDTHVRHNHSTRRVTRTGISLLVEQQVAEQQITVISACMRVGIHADPFTTHTELGLWSGSQAQRQI